MNFNWGGYLYERKSHHSLQRVCGGYTSSKDTKEWIKTDWAYTGAYNTQWTYTGRLVKTREKHRVKKYNGWLL